MTNSKHSASLIGHSTSGMTLLEVLAVLLVLGVLALSAVSRMSPGQVDLITTTEGITSRLRLVQSIAMNSPKGIQGVRFEAGPQKYSMFHCDNPANCDMTSASIQPLQGAVVDAAGKMDVSDGTVRVQADGNVAYDTFGKPYQVTGRQAVPLANPLVLSFSDTAGNTRTIKVTPKTGFIP